MSWVTDVGYNMYTSQFKTNQDQQIHQYESTLMNLMAFSGRVNRMPNKRQAQTFKNWLQQMESHIKQKLELAKAQRQAAEQWQESSQKMTKESVKSFATFSEKA